LLTLRNSLSLKQVLAFSPNQKRYKRGLIDLKARARLSW
jgi:hypothetical protein